MCNLQIRSSNKNFSWVLGKNPESGMLIKSVRSGHLFGWYQNDNIYNVYFKDGDDEVSYNTYKDEFEYQNVSRYNSPYFVLDVVNQYFKHNLKEEVVYDIPSENTITICNVFLKRLQELYFFQKEFTQISLEYEQTIGDNYKITIKNNGTLHELFSITSLLFLLLAIRCDHLRRLEDDMIKKYINIINSLDVSYYIRNIFKINLFNHVDQFNKNKEDLEKSNKYNIKLEFGNTQQQRYHYVYNHYKTKYGDIIKVENILDIGCGEGDYLFRLCSKIQGKYIGIERDQEIRELIQRKCKARGHDNVWVYESIDEFLESDHSKEEVNVLIMEVIEHNEKDEVIDILSKVFNKVDFKDILITTPNIKFNKYYNIDGFRHDDHKFELTPEEFQYLTLKPEVGENILVYEDFVIGDRVNGESSILGQCIENIADDELLEYLNGLSK